jgi:hypothetical protein
MSNQAVSWYMYWAVIRAVREAVIRAVEGFVYWAVKRAGDGDVAVYQAVYLAVYRAVGEDTPHAAIELYLVAVA